jgi:hypothetical protein
MPVGSNHKRRSGVGSFCFDEPGNLRRLRTVFADEHEPRCTLHVRQLPLTERDFRRPGADESVLSALMRVSQRCAGEAARHGVAYA